MVLRQNTRCELKIRVEKKMNLLVLDQQIHLFFNSQFNKTKQQPHAQLKRMPHSFPPKNNSVRIHLFGQKESQLRKIMRENKTLTGAIGPRRLAPCGPRAPRVRIR